MTSHIIYVKINIMDNQNFNQQDKINDQQTNARLEKYVGPEGISTKELEAGLWYVEHRRQLRMALIIFLAIISAVSWAYTIYGFAYYLARGMKEDEILTKQLVEASSVGHEYVSKVSAKQLILSPIGVLSSSGNKYDLYTVLENDNERWWAEFDYYFTASGRQTKKSSGYILPFESKYLTALAQEFDSQPQNANLVMENIKWHRVNQHEISDWQTFRDSRLNIEASDIKFTPAGGSQKLNQLSFNITNNTAYNYWDVGFTILLTSGGNLISINHYGLSDFMSGETRLVEINWAGATGSISQAKIIPEINIMKDDIYIPYEGGIGQEK